MHAQNLLPDPHLFRKTVSLFATGIAVVTTTDAEGRTHGVTVNSFTSISLGPPTVMVSLKEGTAHSLISSSGWYGVSVLRQDQRAYSSHFSGRRDAVQEPRFAEGHKVPTIEGSIARFECEVTHQISIHDHTLFVARVAWCSPSEGAPLLFFASRDSHELISG